MLRGSSRPEIADDQEPVQQPAVAIEQREVLLVLPHRQDQTFLRHREEGLVEAAGVDGGALDERRHLVEQRVVLAQAGVSRSHAQQLGDARPSCLETRDDRALGFEDACIVARMLHPQLSRPVEAVPARGIPRRLTEDFPGHHAGPVELDQTVYRAHEQVFACAPAHELGDRQVFDRGLHDAGQVIVDGFAGLARAEHEVFGLAVGHLLQRVRCYAAGAGEPLQRLGGLAVGTDAGAHCRALAFDFTVGLLPQHVVDRHGQTARGRIRCHLGAAVHKAQLLQALADAGGEAVAELLQGLGRQLFGEQLDEQRVSWHGDR